MNHTELKTVRKNLYKAMYEHTVGECSENCRLPQSCCSPEYCHIFVTEVPSDGQGDYEGAWD